MTIRVLHVVTSMGRGGLEVWLMHVLRNIDRREYHFDFIVQSDETGMYDNEVRSLGSRVFRCPRGNHLIAFARAYLKVLKEYGPFDIVHTHVHHFSGIVALLSRLGGVKKIIAHSHNANYGDRRKLGLAKRLYLHSTEWLMRRFTVYGLGCSQRAGEDLFQADWKDQSRHRVLYCGLDFARFRTTSRLQLEGVPPAPHTIIHIGRFTTPKNHDFLVDVIAALEQRRSDYRVLLVGGGDLEERIMDKVRRLGLAQRVFHLGDRNNVAELLQLGEVFLFPSLSEGLGLALIEAQAAGLRCLVSDTVPAEASVLPGATLSMSLQAGAERWAAALDELLNAPPLDRRAALEFMQASPFSIENSIRELSALYRRLAGRAVERHA